MNKLTLVHRYTPSILLDVTQQLEKVLSEKEPDEEGLLSLVNLRDDLLVEFLQTLNESEKQAFVNEELITNKKITDLAQNLLNSSLSVLSKHIRGKKAVKKYK